MEQQSGFTKMTIDEFETWITQQSVARNVVTIQQHHTFLPNYANFNGTNHFRMQSGMKNFHINSNNFSDIGQHFSTFPDGAIVTGRPLNKSPACIRFANSGCICIEHVGDFDAGQDEMTAAQADTAIRMTAALLDRFGLGAPDENNIVYHHWYDARGAKRFGVEAVKSCPGTAFFGGNKLDDFNANFRPRVAAAMGAAPPPPQPLPQPAPPASPAGTPEMHVVVTADFLNIRTGPGSDNPKITEHGPAEHGSILRVFDTQNRWHRISNTKQHWVFSRFTRPVTPATVNTDGTNVRTGPGTDHPVAQVFDAGHKVFVRGTEGRWSRIEHERWIHASLLDI